MKKDLMKSERYKIARREQNVRKIVLTLDDLDMTNWEHNLLVAQLRARYQAARETASGKPLKG